MKFAVKRLTRSDLTLFDVQFRRQNAGNQKSINLNRDVFVDILFPSAVNVTGGSAKKFPCELTILGPGGVNNPLTLMRKVIAAGGRQKNWRLNGETIKADPDASSPDRFDNLKAGDICVFGFDGEIVPNSVTLVLVQHGHLADEDAYTGLNAFVGDSSMLPISISELRIVTERTPLDHPLREIVDEELDVAIEDAAMGFAEAINTLRTRGTRRTTLEALAQAKANAERIGRDGEVLVDAFLRGETEVGNIEQHKWVSETNATNPYDFSVLRSATEFVPVEVKTTSGSHDRPIFVSQAEMEFAALNVSLEVWRVSEMKDGRAIVRFSKALPTLAQNLKSLTSQVPSGVLPNGWAISPSVLEPWSLPIEISSDQDPTE